jgi:alpha-D-ribose 1-methylphosphonate 5-triphosphate synthase subunit PhnH
MADNATPIWLSPSFAQDDSVLDNLRFYCSSPMSETSVNSAFAIVSGKDLVAFDWDSAQFNIGNEEYPDQSTTVIVEIEDDATTECTTGQILSLTGPGIERNQSLELRSVPASFIQFLEKRQERFAFPLGVDLILASKIHVVAIPRTTSVEVMPCM